MGHGHHGTNTEHLGEKQKHHRTKYKATKLVKTHLGMKEIPVGMPTTAELKLSKKTKHTPTNGHTINGNRSTIHALLDFDGAILLFDACSASVASFGERQYGGDKLLRYIGTA